MIAKHTLVQGGIEKQIPSLRYRMYSATELVNMGRTAGLGVSRAYGDFDGGDLTMNSKRVILVFKKTWR